MGKLVLNPEYELFERDGRPFCTSRQIAGTFQKTHDKVLRDVRELDCSEGFRLSNFGESSYLNEQRKRQPEVLMTKDGFAFLVMGYRGKRAAAFKEAYITRFNRMEEFIKSLLAAKLEYPAFTEAVMLSHDEPKHYHFSNEADMINRLVLGMTAKMFRDSHGIESGQSIRPFLDTSEISDIQRLQMADVGLLYSGVQFDQRKEILRECLRKRRSRLSLVS